MGYLLATAPSSTDLPVYLYAYIVVNYSVDVFVLSVTRAFSFL